jgi:hypothetical protein
LAPAPLFSPETVVRFGLVGMGVAPAGVEKANTGHHHLLIDTPLPETDEPIPNDFDHLHFGLGQTEAKVKLPLGTHTLQLLLGDENHLPHDPPIMSAPVKVLVTANGKRPRPRYKKPREMSCDPRPLSTACHFGVKGSRSLKPVTS